jgi:hypothetical protein
VAQTPIGATVPIRAKIVEFVELKARGVTAVACDVLEGEISSNMLMKVDGREDVWKIVGIKVPTPPELYETGRRGAILAPQRDGQKKLEIGDCLEAL